MKDGRGRCPSLKSRRTQQKLARGSNVAGLSGLPKRPRNSGTELPPRAPGGATSSYVARATRLGGLQAMETGFTPGGLYARYKNWLTNVPETYFTTQTKTHGGGTLTGG